MNSEEYVIERIKKLEEENESLKNQIFDMKNDNAQMKSIIDDVREDLLNNSTNYSDYFYVSVGISFNSKIANELNITHDEIENYNKGVAKNE